MKTLVVGCDASGKSSFLEAVHNEWGDTYGESTSTDESRVFKRASLDRLVDADFVTQREALYIDLSKQALLSMKATEANVITSDSSLVTRLSHSVMRQILDETFLDNNQILKAWIEDESKAGASPPEIIVHTKAPIEIIKSRIKERQMNGDKLEKYWGFNSPFFLNAYQNRWSEMMITLSEQGLESISLDTSVLSPAECVQKYSRLRRKLSGHNG